MKEVPTQQVWLFRKGHEMDAETIWPRIDKQRGTVSRRCSRVVQQIGGLSTQTTSSTGEIWGANLHEPSPVSLELFPSFGQQPVRFNGKVKVKGFDRVKRHLLQEPR